MSRRKISVRKYPVTAYQRKALESLMPPEDLTVSEWAEKYRMLDSKTSALPGPWRNEMTPYLVGIMDALLDYETEEIVLCKSAQLGGTEAILNALGYIIQQDPSPTMVVYPSDVLAESISKNRIIPMVQVSPTLRERYQPFDSKKLELQFDGMYLSLVGSNSPSNLASKAIRFLFLDEVDKYPGASAKEADPVALARERTKTFGNRKIFITSTPTITTGHIWKALQSCDVEKHYFVPCPRCGEMIELKWANLKFPNDEGMSYADRAEMAHYVCPECKGIITDQHKARMLRLGEWRAVKQSSPYHRKAGFWINTLYSPFVRFSDVAREFLASKDDPEKLQNFVNSWLAEPWEDTKLKTSADLVMERQTMLGEGIVPSWGKLLTAGVDVQENCVYWTVRAWGSYITSQNIAHGQAASLRDLERVMNLSFPKEGSGEAMVVNLCLIDSGYEADMVYDFCAANSEWALPSKGASSSMYTHYRMSKVNKPTSRAYGMDLVVVDTGKYKDMIASRMRKGPDEKGRWTVYAGCDREYAEQVTAEHKVNVKRGGRTTQEWVQKHSHGDNHYLDCEVGAMCAADILNVRFLYLEDEGEERPAGPAPAPLPEEAWIQENENWI